MANREGEGEATGSRGLGIQQQSGWDQFFDHGLDDLLPDTETNGGGCLAVYDGEQSVKKLGSAGEVMWENSYEMVLYDLLPVSEANGGGYLIAFDDELVRLGQDGSTQWQRSYGSEEMEGSFRAVTEAGTGGFLFGGSTYIDDDSSVSWVSKISEDGTVTWELEQTLLGDRQAYGQNVTEIHRVDGGGYILKVIRYHSVWFVRIDEGGAIEWNLHFTEYSETYVTDEGSVLVVDLEDPSLTRVTPEGARQWTRDFDSWTPPDQVLASGNEFLVATWSRGNTLEMLRDDGTRRWWRTYDQSYTVTHAQGDGYVLFGTDSVIKIDADGTEEWERPLFLPTGIEYVSALDGGGYLLGGGGGPSWIAMRETLAGGVAVLPDVNGDGNPSQDPDGDGLYEDVNGDGSVNVGDAQALYNNRNSAAIRINGELYDFNDDGAVNVGDAQALFAEVTGDD